MDTSRTADIHSSCLLCLRRQRLQKIDISNTVAFLGYFDYSLDLLLISIQKKQPTVGCFYNSYQTMIVLKIILKRGFYTYESFVTVLQILLRKQALRSFVQYPIG